MLRNSFKILTLFIFLFSLISCRVGVEQRRNLIEALPFEKNKWNAFTYEDRVKFRPGMARTLVHEKSLVKKSRAEIIQTLGEDENGRGPNEIRYVLEDIYGSNIDPIAVENLKITFNSENKVEKAEIEFSKTSDWRD